MLSNGFTTNKGDILKGMLVFVYAYMLMICSSLILILKISTKQRSFSFKLWSKESWQSWCDLGIKVIILESVGPYQIKLYWESS